MLNYDWVRLLKCGGGSVDMHVINRPLDPGDDVELPVGATVRTRLCWAVRSMMR